MRRQLLLPALALLVAACQPPDAGEQAAAAELDPGLVTVESDVAFEETYDRLRTAIEGNENLRILAEVDHGANAAGVDRELPPTRLILFGNPDLGTPLMEGARTTAIDLPQKLLVWADAAGRVFITYNDPAYLQRRHGIEGRDEILATIAGALGSLADTARQ
ncbi:MAG: DUF302 domain-containing protein [Longimicrobiales bacterium]